MRTLAETDLISAADVKLLQEVKKVIHRFLPTASVLLYGSVARGTQSGESDYDLLVLADAPITAEEEDAVQAALFDLEVARDAVISARLCDKDRWNSPIVRVSPFRREVEREAVAL